MKKVVTWLLACLMILSSLPLAAFAEGVEVDSPTPEDFCEVADGTASEHIVTVTNANCTYDILEIPECNSEGLAEWKLQCRICQVSFVGKLAVPTAHEWDEENVVPGSLPNCGTETNGKKPLATCKVCDAVDPARDGSTIQWEHDYVDPEVEIKDHAGNVYYAEDGACKTCGKVQGIIDDTDNKDHFIKHYWETTPNITLEPTCATAGTAVYRCTQKDCTVTKTVVIKKVKCDSESITHSPAKKAVSCKEYGTFEYWYCKDCKTYYKKADLSSKYANQDATIDYKSGKGPHGNRTKVEETIGADCVTPGIKEHWQCDDCGDLFTTATGLTTFDPTKAAAENGKYGPCASREWLTYVSATDCDNSGYQAHWYCDVCCVTKAWGYDSEDPALDSTRADYTNVRLMCESRTYVPATNSPNCYTFGTREYYECTVCDTYYKTANTWDAYENKNVSDDNKKLHADDYAVVGKEPTCTEPGNPDYFRCSVCTAHYGVDTYYYKLTDVKPIESIDWASMDEWKATGHAVQAGHETHYVNSNTSWSNTACVDGDALYDGKWVSASATGKTCGVYERKCAKCGETYEEDLNHKYTDFVANSDATDCTVNGLVKTCIQCGDKQYKAITNAHKYETMDTLSYEYKAPDCVNPGYSRIVCSKCDMVWAVGYANTGTISTKYVNSNGTLVTKTTGTGLNKKTTLVLPTAFADTRYVDINLDGKINNSDKYQGAYLMVGGNGVIAPLGHDTKNGANTITVYGSCINLTYTFTYCTRETCPLDKTTQVFWNDTVVDDGDGANYSLTKRYGDKGETLDATGYKLVTFAVSEAVKHNIDQFEWDAYVAAKAKSDADKDAYLYKYFWHSWSFDGAVKIVDPTCTTDARITFTCEFCQENTSKVCDDTKLDHLFKADSLGTSVDDTNHAVVCSRTDCVAIGNVKHTFNKHLEVKAEETTDVNCTTHHYVKCDYCDYVGEQKHTNGKLTKLEGNDTQHQVQCQYCTYTWNENHTYNQYFMLDSTAPGYTMEHGVKCACGNIGIGGQEHTYSSTKTNTSCIAVDVKNGTNTVSVPAGQQYALCNKCTYIKVIIGTPFDYDQVYNTLDDAKVNHGKNNLTLKSADLCGTVDGKVTYTCKQCNHDVFVKVPTTHLYTETFTAYSTNKKVTLSGANLAYAECGKEYTCENPGCGNKEVLNAHEYSEEHDFTNPTCNATGNRPYYECVGTQKIWHKTSSAASWTSTTIYCECIRYMTDNGYEYADSVEDSDRVIPKLTHKIELVDSASLCSGVSYQHYACKNCDFENIDFKPSVAQEYIDGYRNTKHINAAGQTFATKCEATLYGITDIVCVSCHGEIADGHASTGKTHNYVGDCQIPGWLGYDCGVCGTLVKTHVDADTQPHQYSQWQIIREGDEKQNGLQRKTCKVCKEVVEELIVTVNATYSLVVEPLYGEGVYTIGSTVKVTVLLNSTAAVKLSGAQAVIAYDQANLIFDKVTKADGSPLTTVSSQKPADGYVVVSMTTANGMNATLDGKVAVATLYFVVSGGIQEFDDKFATAESFAQMPTLAIAEKVGNFQTNAINEEFADTPQELEFNTLVDTTAVTVEISDWFDFNADGIVDVKDQLKVTQCVFNDKYDARFDVNKNGTIDAGEVPYMSQYINGEITAWELFKMGLSAKVLSSF